MEEIMLSKKNYKFWFATGSQSLYGEECLNVVAQHSKIIVDKLNQSKTLPFEVVLKPTLISNELDTLGYVLKALWLLPFPTTDLYNKEAPNGTPDMSKKMYKVTLKIVRK